MDHRAEEETNAINATGDKCLKYVGGQMSIEMELPKMKWLKHHKPGGIDDCKFYDLADFLVHKATGTETRSFCSVVCKQDLFQLVLMVQKLDGQRTFACSGHARID